MKLSQFISLNAEEKKETLLCEGILIGKRKSPDIIVFLFQMDGFYVELYCNPLQKLVLEYQAFVNTSLLKPYLESIALDGLV